ncbi:ARM repeat-containing protein, partial [Linderina pennispora]
MDESIQKRRQRQQTLQRANIDSWLDRNARLDTRALDANLKKNTGFIKKCKASMGQDNAPQLLREVKLLRLDKYVSEIVPAAAEGLLKCKQASDVNAAIDVISALHTRFPATFTVPLIVQILKHLQAPKVTALAQMTSEQREKEEQARQAKQRALLRIVGEMFLSGLLWGIDAIPDGVEGIDRVEAFLLSFAGAASGSKVAGKVRDLVKQPGYSVFAGVLQNLFLSDKEHHLSCVLAASVAKAFRSDFALAEGDSLDTAASVVNLAGMQNDTSEHVVTEDMCKRVKSILQEYCDTAVEHVTSMHKNLVKMRRKAEERLFTKGVVHTEVKEKLERHEKSFDRLAESVRLLCESLAREPPHLEDKADDDDQLGISFDAPATPARKWRSKVWDDDEERLFYEVVLDLQSQLPPTLLATQKKKKNQPTEKPAAASDTKMDDLNEEDIKVDLQAGAEDGDDDAGVDEAANAASMIEYQQFLEQRQRGGAGDGQDAKSDSEIAAPVAEKEPKESSPAEGVDDAKDGLTVVQKSGSSGDTVHSFVPVKFHELLSQLPTMTSKERVDQMAVNFCYVNSKGNRVRLIRALADVPRKQLFLIPYYARIMATLQPDLLDLRLKNVRYIAELTKFKVAPLHVAFRCGKSLLEQFNALNIEVLCSLLDNCGRFLLAQVETAGRIENILDILRRKRRVLDLDDRISLLIDNACRLCQPGDTQGMVVSKFRTPYERYIRKLIYEDLSTGTLADVAKRLRRLPWNDTSDQDPQRVKLALVNCFTKIWKVNHAQMPLLHVYHPWLRVTIVDTVLENIKVGLERNLFVHNQRRIAEIRYVGQMFLCPSLYMLTRYGHHEPHPVPGRSCEIDAFDDHFRIRLICTLLIATRNFIKGAEAQRAIEEFSVYFQMYILAKQQPLPIDIGYTVDQTFEAGLRKVQRFATWEEAAQAMEALVQTKSMRTNSEVQAPQTQSANDQAAAAAYEEEEEEEEEEDEDLGASDQRQRQRMEEARRQMEDLKRLLEKEEEDRLEHEFMRLMVDSSDQRTNERTGKLDNSDDSDEGEPADNAIRFALLTGKKQRPVVRAVDIPVESAIARNLRIHEQATMREKQNLKKIEQRMQGMREQAARRARATSAAAPQPAGVPGATFVAKAPSRRNGGRR